MRENDTAALESAATDDSTDTELDERDVRALTEYLTVLPDTGRARGADDMFLVVSQSGSEYLVDARLEACECPDAQHRDPDGGCKHVRRVAFATGARSVPAWVETDAVGGELGEHVETEQAVATDGGLVEDDTDDTSGRTFTYHHESYEQGGARYIRCELCGAECVPANPDRLAHFDGCPEGRR